MKTIVFLINAICLGLIMYFTESNFYVIALVIIIAVNNYIDGLNDYNKIK